MWSNLFILPLWLIACIFFIGFSIVCVIWGLVNVNENENLERMWAGIQPRDLVLPGMASLIGPLGFWMVIGSIILFGIRVVVWLTRLAV